MRNMPDSGVIRADRFLFAVVAVIAVAAIGSAVIMHAKAARCDARHGVLFKDGAGRVVCVAPATALQP